MINRYLWLTFKSDGTPVRLQKVGTHGYCYMDEDEEAGNVLLAEKKIKKGEELLRLASGSGWLEVEVEAVIKAIEEHGAELIAGGQYGFLMVAADDEHKFTRLNPVLIKLGAELGTPANIRPKKK